MRPLLAVPPPKAQLLAKPLPPVLQSPPSLPRPPPQKSSSTSVEDDMDVYVRLGKRPPTLTSN
eukprot:2723542-Prorocentrum_lima.AAC.1